MLFNDGDGPGGSNTLMAYHPETGTLVIGLINQFGAFDEQEFLLDDMVETALIGLEQQ